MIGQPPSSVPLSLHRLEPRYSRGSCGLCLLLLIRAVDLLRLCGEEGLERSWEDVCRVLSGPGPHRILCRSVRADSECRTLVSCVASSSREYRTILSTGYAHPLDGSTFSSRSWIEAIAVS